MTTDEQPRLGGSEPVTPPAAPATDSTSARPAADAAPPAHPRPRRPPHPIRVVVITAVLALAATGFVSTALTPTLATKNPLLMLALESPIRNMLLARSVHIVPFVLVAVFRRVGAACLYYLLGRWYGDAAVRWVERRAGRGGRAVRTVERLVRSAAVPMVFLYPGPVVCVVAGSMGMRPPAFLGISLAGSLSLALACRFLGDVLARPIDAVLGFFSRNLLVVSLVVATIAILLAVWRLRGGSEKLEGISEVEHELEEG